MKFAIVNNVRTEAQKGLKGFCSVCGSELVAKCGTNRVHHWSHKKTRVCDQWWENETEWHRVWKNNYPIQWQEYLFVNPKDNQKHIADVYTPTNLVIEFQHSRIHAEERESRELFYKNMVWVVDCSKFKRAYPRFLKSAPNFKKADSRGLHWVEYIDEVFPVEWINSKVPVVFDFKGLEDISDISDLRHNLYCLFQIRNGRYSLLAEFSRNAFLKATMNGDWEERCQNLFKRYHPLKEKVKKPFEMQASNKQVSGNYYFDERRSRFIKKWRF